MSIVVDFENNLLRPLKTSSKGWISIRGKKNTISATEDNGNELLCSALKTSDSEVAQEASSFLQDYPNDATEIQDTNILMDGVEDLKVGYIGINTVCERNFTIESLSNEEITIVLDILLQGKRKTMWETKNTT